ncbi:MAG TPA: flavodoxin domain-containing protein [Gaiellaceae bacterium]|nr:flavodoxin domain-containing protein [Gaiellaceae bacterium]
MRSLVVYESWFGNTRRVAEEIAGGLAQAGEVEVVSVDEPLPPLADVDLLVVGAPTHVHGLSGRHSREAALEQGGHGEAGTGVRGWIAGLPNGARGPRAAAFDTRADKPVLLVGSAARGIARRLREHGYALAAEPESFFVEGTPGPLEEGELERAAEWGRELVTSA